MSSVLIVKKEVGVNQSNRISQMYKKLNSLYIESILYDGVDQCKNACENLGMYRRSY